MCTQHQHFYLPTCQPVSSHTCYSQIMLHYLASSHLHSFAFPLPLLESCFHFRVSRQKRSISPARPICFISFSLYHFVPLSPLFFLLHLSAFFFFCGPAFPFPSPSSGHRLPPTPPPLWWDPDVELLRRTTAPQNLHSLPPKGKCWAAVPSDKPYNVGQHHKPVNRGEGHGTEP